MVDTQYEVVWTKRSLKQLKKAYEYISKSSPKNAAKVIAEIAEAVHKATPNPEIYNPDKYKIDNDGSYRALEKHHYRVVYRFTRKTIRVLRVRHTSMEPLEY
jgi:addiction module RelE/StbE family toxin